jgi:hypothetical protein
MHNALCVSAHRHAQVDQTRVEVTNPANDKITVVLFVSVTTRETGRPDARSARVADAPRRGSLGAYRWLLSGRAQPGWGRRGHTHLAAQYLAAVQVQGQVQIDPLYSEQ